jgi:thiamine-phosphate pyrophosphorylase
MRIDPEKLKLYLVTDRRFNPDPLVEQVRRAIAGGVTCIQVREKNTSTGEFVELAAELLKLCREQKVPLIINDRIDIALAIEADGVHLGRSDMPIALARKLMGDRYIIGATASTIAEAQAAEASGADYLGVGAVVATATKADHSQVIGLDGLAKVCKSVSIPCVGIAGIDQTNAKAVRQTGAAGIAVVSAILAADDQQAAASQLRTAIENL